MGQKRLSTCPSPSTKPYQESLAVFVESDLLQPYLHLTGLPVGNRGQDAPRNLLPDDAQHLFGQGGGGAAGGVAHNPLQALRGPNLTENLGTPREEMSLCFPSSSSQQAVLGQHIPFPVGNLETENFRLAVVGV